MTSKLGALEAHDSVEITVPNSEPSDSSAISVPPHQVHSFLEQYPGAEDIHLTVNILHTGRIFTDGREVEPYSR